MIVAKKISQLDPAVTPSDADIYPVVQSASGPRKQTLLALRNAITAAFSSTVRSFLSSSTVLDAQTSLQLIKQTSVSDPTAGRLLTNGSWGWNGGTAISLPGGTDADTMRTPGEYAFGAGGTNLPNNAQAWYVRVVQHLTLTLQVAYGMTAANKGQVWTRFHNGTSFQTWDRQALAGANGDITSLTGLTTPLTVGQGGTGVNTSTGTGAGVHAASPALTGTPTAPTPAVGTNTTQIATAAMIQAEIANKRGWTSYTPGFTASSGTYTSASATGSYMIAFGICFWRAIGTITTKGTGATPRIGLPVPALAGLAGAPIPARAINVNFKSGSATIETGLTTALISAADTTDLGSADGAIIHIMGAYPIA